MTVSSGRGGIAEPTLAMRLPSDYDRGVFDWRGPGSVDQGTVFDQQTGFCGHQRYSGFRLHKQATR
jgi:hypothetical protein